VSATEIIVTPDGRCRGKAKTETKRHGNTATSCQVHPLNAGTCINQHPIEKAEDQEGRRARGRSATDDGELAWPNVLAAFMPWCG
jgi:DNA-directed RNA polymerase beta subunit